MGTEMGSSALGVLDVLLAALAVQAGEMSEDEAVDGLFERMQVRQTQRMHYAPTQRYSGWDSCD